MPHTDHVTRKCGQKDALDAEILKVGSGLGNQILLCVVPRSRRRVHNQLEVLTVT